MKTSIKIIILSFTVILTSLTSGGINAMENNAFDFNFTSIEGNPMPLSEYEGKAVLVVNTASQCGFTPQYEGLQSLWDEYKDKGLVVIGVPSNDFGTQEPNKEGVIKEFCETTFGINFPMTEKNIVKGSHAHPFYQWAQGQTGKFPKWNFYKYLIAPDGTVAGFYSSLTKPKSTKVIKAIEKILPND